MISEGATDVASVNITELEDADAFEVKETQSKSGPVKKNNKTSIKSPNKKQPYKKILTMENLYKKKRHLLHLHQKLQKAITK
ncbi:MAG: hypothetical protein LBD98_02860 [Endomicrobium sp.]|nr:hypothetical protein [Endomicrobium sp.]